MRIRAVHEGVLKPSFVRFSKFLGVRRFQFQVENDVIHARVALKINAISGAQPDLANVLTREISKRLIFCRYI